MNSIAGRRPPLAADEARGRLLITSRDGRLLAIGTANGRKLAAVDVASRCDSLIVDSSRKRVYVVAEGKPTGVCNQFTCIVIDTFHSESLMDKRTSQFVW